MHGESYRVDGRHYCTPTYQSLNYGSMLVASRDDENAVIHLGLSDFTARRIVLRIVHFCAFISLSVCLSIYLLTCQSKLHREPETLLFVS